LTTDLSEDDDQDDH